jgi:hypothetical protein
MSMKSGAEETSIAPRRNSDLEYIRLIAPIINTCSLGVILGFINPPE